MNYEIKKLNWWNRWKYYKLNKSLKIEELTKKNYKLIMENGIVSKIRFYQLKDERMGLFIDWYRNKVKAIHLISNEEMNNIYKKM